MRTSNKLRTGPASRTIVACLAAGLLLTACGGGGSSSTPNQSPTAAFSMTPDAGIAPATISFNAGASTDDSGIKAYAWNFGDGDTGSGKTADHQYLVAGTYTATLTVTDGDGATDTIKHTVSISNTGGDPLYGLQWHLKNTGQYGWDGTPGKVGEDINVEPVWAGCADGTCHGEGEYVAVVDDGMEIAHPDLQANVSTAVGRQSYDYVSGSYGDPTPSTSTASDPNAHGTAVSGIIAARDVNDIGGRGVAPRAGLVGYNLLQNSSAANEGDAMTRQDDQVSIYSNSWGPTDGTGLLTDSNNTWKSAIANGLSSGRGGLGAIYVWAAGNGCMPSSSNPDVCLADNSNFDGYANHYGIIAVGAVNDQGTRSSYSEKGANLWVSAPGGEYCDTHTIVTTDLTGTDGFNSLIFSSDLSNHDYTRCMNGTSAATPMVSGVAALVLQANPNLTWRDVRAILAGTARKNDPTDGGWSTNNAGYHINDNYGFGVVDASAAVTAAKTWIPSSCRKDLRRPDTDARQQHPGQQRDRRQRQRSDNR